MIVANSAFVEHPVHVACPVLAECDVGCPPDRSGGAVVCLADSAILLGGWG